MVGAIQTFGQLIHAHPHIHALVTEGVFLPDGTFLPLPKLATEPFLKLWEQEVFALLLAEGKITEEVVANIRSWRHSGFSVANAASSSAACVRSAARIRHGTADPRARAKVPSRRAPGPLRTARSVRQSLPCPYLMAINAGLKPNLLSR
jgi:hypothetical protein